MHVLHLTLNSLFLCLYYLHHKGTEQIKEKTHFLKNKQINELKKNLKCIRVKFNYRGLIFVTALRPQGYTTFSMLNPTKKF